MNFLIIAYLILLFYLSWRRIDWAVFLILATLPSYLIRFKFAGIPFTLLEAMILISFSVWFIKNYKQVIKNLKLRINSKFKIKNYNLIRYPFDWEIVLVLIVSFVAVGVAGFSNSALGIWKAYFFEPALFYILLFNVFKYNPNAPNNIRMLRMNNIIWPLAISALGVSLVAIYQYITGDLIFNEFWANPESRRAVSVFGYPNAVGLYLAPIVMILIGYFSSVIIKRDAPRRVFTFVFLSVVSLFSVLSIFFAKSEGALIGLAAGLFIFGILANKKLRWITIIFSVLFMIGVFAYQPIRTKAIDKITLMDLSGQIRKAQWKETWEMLRDGRLITGSGLDNYQSVIAPYHAEGIFVRDPHDPDWHKKTVFNEEFRNSVWQPLEIYMYPHNIFLNFWTELGLAGMILFIWIIIKFFMMGISNYQETSNKQIQNSKFKIQNFCIQEIKYINIALMCSMLVILIHGLVDVPYFKNDLAVIFWVIVAMMSLVNLDKNS